MSRGNARQVPALPPGGGLPPQPVAQKLVPGPAVPLLPTDGPRSDAVQPPAPQFHKAAKSKSAYENVVDLDEEQLRGVSLTALLAGGAALFKDHGAAARENPQATYALSRQCISLDYFCSHSWSTSRWQKYVALLVHFNLGRALLAALMAVWISTMAQLWVPDHIPDFFWSRYPIPPDMAMGRGPWIAELIVGPVFLLVFFTAHRFSPARSLFLDIACIDQSSDAAKANGIAALGAVLDRSERMLVLCDRHYFSRLWCTFELAAYTKRAGTSRIDLLPLHEALVILAIMVDVVFYFVVPTYLGLFLSAWVLEACHHHEADACHHHVSAETFAMFIPLFMIAGSVPSQGFVLMAMMEAHKGRIAMAGLRRYRLADAQCHSDSDREELRSLIAKWFTERSDGGDDDAEDARRVGFHRFEKFVAHTVAPSLVNSSSYVKIALCVIIFMGSGFMDSLCSDAFTSFHAGMVVQIPLLLVMVPVKLALLSRSARVTIALRERCGCPAALAYGVGILLNTCTIVVSMIVMFGAGPQMFFDPSYRLPDDGLDATGRNMLASQIATLYAIIVGVGVAANFKF